MLQGSPFQDSPGTVPMPRAGCLCALTMRQQVPSHTIRNTQAAEASEGAAHLMCQHLCCVTFKVSFSLLFGLSYVAGLTSTIFVLYPGRAGETQVKSTSASHRLYWLLLNTHFLLWPFPSAPQPTSLCSTNPSFSSASSPDPLYGHLSPSIKTTLRPPSLKESPGHCLPEACTDCDPASGSSPSTTSSPAAPPFQPS